MGMINTNMLRIPVQFKRQFLNKSIDNSNKQTALQNQFVYIGGSKSIVAPLNNAL
ncbi:hypothetical protein Elgi_05580 [Paenibacillus elgii]|nr:hypothetical protein Elgi_05580 [Paenibacillus elgii]